MAKENCMAAYRSMRIFRKFSCTHAHIHSEMSIVTVNTHSQPLNSMVQITSTHLQKPKLKCIEKSVSKMPNTQTAARPKAAKDNEQQQQQPQRKHIFLSFRVYFSGAILLSALFCLFALCAMKYRLLRLIHKSVAIWQSLFSESAMPMNSPSRRRKRNNNNQRKLQ